MCGIFFFAHFVHTILKRIHTPASLGPPRLPLGSHVKSLGQSSASRWRGFGGEGGGGDAVHSPEVSIYVCVWMNGLLILLMISSDCEAKLIMTVVFCYTHTIQESKVIVGSLQSVSMLSQKRFF